MIIHVRKGLLFNKAAHVLLPSVLASMLQATKANLHWWHVPGEYFHTHNEAHPHARLFEHTRIHFELKTSFERVSGSHCAGNESTLHCLGSVHYVLPNPAVSLPTWVMVSKMREETKVSGRAMQAAFVQFQLPRRCCPLCVQIGTAVSFANWPAGNNEHAVASGEKTSKTSEK